ncbi:hypothetical protein KGA66_00120 [Actinocrinis puniceicyclus]|uniref:DUF5709 domain-containing protein n=1 Tax=Actinocrinis puniceicyclus TaxID=977794 RepID=A0A8J7WHH8_9ACTN|nr:DUF5709 domain-containing protein [Actinocrinis puniceicyclus]MBS2961428.1 hypothetical protein [Actinocrinis puniceicyclus]
MTTDQSENPIEPQDVPEDDGVLQPGDSLETDDLASDPLDTGISPPERRPASERYGVTFNEARTGAPLDQRLAEEEPDFGEPASLDNRPEPESDAPPDPDQLEPDRRAGRLVAEDEGAHTVSSPNYLARDMGIDGGAASAEEAAMHIADADVRDTRERDAEAAESWQDPLTRDT